MACSGLVYLLLLLQIHDVQSVVQKVTRYEPEGDAFSNPDGDNCDPNSCIGVGGSVMQTDNCKCSCNYKNTFVVHNTICVPNKNVHSNLLASLPEKDASFRVTRESDDCRPPNIRPMSVLNIARPDSGKLCMIGTEITKCTIIKKDSKYFYNGTWYPIWPTNRKQDTFNITEDEYDSYLEWTSLGQQFTGLIFGLKISCQLKTSLPAKDTLGSYLIFKSAGSHYFDVNGVKPTLAPISFAPTSEAKGPSPTPQSSTTTSPSNSNKGKSSSSSNDKGLIAGVTIVVILIVIVIIVLVVLFLRRKRNSGEEPSEGAKTEANPTYELGQDRTLPVTVNGQPPTYDSPDTPGYQPLVQNTRMRDASGQVPVYTPLNKQTKNNNSPVPQIQTHDKRGLAYETVAIPIQQPATNEPDLAESPDYEDPTNPTIPNEGGLYAVSTPQDGNTIDFENTAYSDPDSVIRIG